MAARYQRSAVCCLAPGGVQRAQRVGGVAVAVLGGAQPPDGGALLVARVTQQEAERAGGPRLAVLGGGEVPAAGLLELAALLQDRAEVQRGPPVATRGGLPVPLLGLVAAGRARRRPARARYAASRCAVLRYGGLRCPCSAAAAASLGAASAVLQQVGQGVGAQRVALLGGLAQPVLGGGLVAALAVVAAQRVRGGAEPATAAIRHQPAASSA